MVYTCLLLILSCVACVWADPPPTIAPGAYEAYNQYNRVYFIETGQTALTEQLKADLRGSANHKVSGRQVLSNGTAVQVTSIQVYTQQEKRAAIVRTEGNVGHLGPDVKQTWKYWAARVRIQDGPQAGKTGWMLYAKMQTGNSAGQTDRHTTVNLRPKGSK